MTFSLHKLLENRTIALITIVVMITQIVFIEGYKVSPVKACLMALMPLVFIFKVPYVSKALILGILYLLSVLFSGLFHPESFRFATIGYLGMFVITFITIYNLIYSGAFSLSFFIKFLRWMILAYAICLLCQQLLILVGIRFMPLINLNNQGFLAIDKLPIWNVEPSHTARIIGALMYGYMQCNGFKQGSPFRFPQLFERQHKWVTYGFLWTMFTMGSGTAFIVVGILSLYFINWRNALIIIPLLTVLIAIGSTMGIEQLDRATSVAEAALTLDNNTVIKADNSAAYRILPLLNTINNLDLTKKEHWFGYGVDTGIANMSQTMLPGITEYGFLSFLCGLLLVFSCAIRFWSIPTIMFFFIIGGGIGNIAYAWGILMIFMCVRYFYKYRNNLTITYNEQTDTCHLHV
jgi:hypothetical protein